MKPLQMLCGALLPLFFVSCSDSPQIDDIRKFAATEIYPEDQYLDSVANKKALVIVAHDDDDCAMAGTIAKLKAAGWQVKQLSFTAHADDEGRLPSSLICDGNELIMTGTYRRGLDTIQFPYLPILLDDMEKQFDREGISSILIEKINSFSPAVIFTLDSELGGYGHPEHLFLSKLVHELYNTGQIKVDRIYQSVYTDHMEKEIVDIWLAERLRKWKQPNATLLAKQMYGVDGMPVPDVQVNILPQAETKMKYLRAYPESVRKNLRKFIPYYEEFGAIEYFNVFDREFFRIIE